MCAVPSTQGHQETEPASVEEVKRRNRSYVDTDQDVVIVVGIAKVSDVPGGPGRVENHVLEHYANGTYTNSLEKLVKSTSSLFWWCCS